MLAAHVAHAMGVASALKPERPRPPIAERPAGNDWPAPALGLRAARTVAGGLVEGSAMWICYMTAKDNASFAVALLAILVLHASTKALCANYLVETGAGARTFAFLSGKCLMRILVCIAIGSATSPHCAAAHALSWVIFEAVNTALTVRGNTRRTTHVVRAVQAVLSLTLIYAETWALTPDEMATVRMVRSVLGVQALCSYAARNTAYHDGDPLDDLCGFWEKMMAHSSKDAVLAIYGASLESFKAACVPILIMAVVSFCPATGKPVVAATVCYLSHLDATLLGTARFVSDLQRFFAFINLVHLMLCSKPIDGLSATHYLLHMAKHLRPCVAGAFGVGGTDSAGRGAPGTSYGCLLCSAAIVNDEARARLPALLEARRGVWRTLPLLDDSVRRAVFDVYNSGVPVTGDRQVAKLICGPPKKWKLAPGD